MVIYLKTNSWSIHLSGFGFGMLLAVMDGWRCTLFTFAVALCAVEDFFL